MELSGEEVPGSQVVVEDLDDAPDCDDIGEKEREVKNCKNMNNLVV